MWVLQKLVKILLIDLANAKPVIQEISNTVKKVLLNDYFRDKKIIFTSKLQFISRLKIKTGIKRRRIESIIKRRIFIK